MVAWIDLSKKCTKLRHLCIDHQSSRNEELEAIADNCLNLAYFSAINIEGFNDIIARFASMQHEPAYISGSGPAGPPSGSHEGGHGRAEGGTSQSGDHGRADDACVKRRR